MASPSAVCPPYRARRKGKVENTNHYAAQRWWRTAAVESLEQAQRDYDRFCAETGDARPRGSRTVADLAAEEPLLALPEQPYPALIEVGRKVGDSSLVAWRGNRYSVLPGLEGASVLVRHRLGSDHLEIVSPLGITLASHLREPDGAGVIRRLDEHRVAQEEAVLAAFGNGRSAGSSQLTSLQELVVCIDHRLRTLVDLESTDVIEHGHGSLTLAGTADQDRHRPTVVGTGRQGAGDGAVHHLGRVLAVKKEDVDHLPRRRGLPQALLQLEEHLGIGLRPAPRIASLSEGKRAPERLGLELEHLQVVVELEALAAHCSWLPSVPRSGLRSRASDNGLAKRDLLSITCSKYCALVIN